MAYRADIEIGVKGIAYLDQLQNKLTQVAKTIDQLNTKNVVVRRTIAGAASAIPMGPGGAGITSASAVAAATAVENKVKAARREETQATIKAVRDRGMAENYISSVIEKRLQAKQKELQLEQKITTETNNRAASGMKSRAGGAISSAIIGGGFPLLFGQGPAAAAGGALGGLAGGLLGGGFGFALSIAGTAIGDLITQSETLNRSLAGLNSSLTSTGSNSVTTADDIKTLAKNLRITNDEALQLVETFSQFKTAGARGALADVFGGVGGAATFEAIARAGVDEKNALNSIFELRKYIGNEAATQLALQLENAGATKTQAELLRMVVELSIKNRVATQSTVQFTDNLLSTWENIVAGVAGALGLAIQFVQKMREGSLLKLPFLDQVANYLSGIKGRSGAQIAKDRGAAAEQQMRNSVKAIFKLVNQETQAIRTQQDVEKGFQPPKKDKAAEEAARAAQRIRDIQMETQAVQQMSYIQGKIAQAEIARDDQLVIRLQGIQREQEVLQNLQKSLEGVTLEKERQALLDRATAQLQQVQLDTAAKLEVAEARRLQNYSDMLFDIQSQIPIEEALSEKTRRRAEIEQQINKLVRDKKLIGEAEINNYRNALLALDQVRERTAQIKRDQAELQNLYQGLAGQISTGIGGAIDLVVRSTDNLGESLQRLAQDILLTVGKMMIFYGLAKAFGALGGSDGAGIFSYLSAAFGGDTKTLGFADGGFVTGPTRAMVGEGGESEYVIPASKMRGAMNRYAAGARGSAVIPAGSEGGDGTTATMAAPSAIDVRYTVERINQVDYVTADQFQRGMQQAASQGAAQGEQRTLRRLQSSNSTRKRLGI